MRTSVLSVDKERLSSTVSLTVLVLHICFVLLKDIFDCCDETSSKQFFICGVKYTRRENEWHLQNFAVGHAKMVAYVSRKRKVDDMLDTDLILPADLI